MLQRLHNKAAGFFVKLLLGLLVASFALWGIGDVFRSSPASAVVTVGDGSVSAQELKNALDQEVEGYRRMLGDQYSPELLKSIGVPAQVLEKLVQQHLVEEEIRAQGIVTPDSYLKSALRDNATFHGEDGRFDVQRFKSILSANNMSEGMYLNLLSKEIGADMLLQSVFSGVQASKTAAKLAYLYENETRKADVLLFSPDMITTIPDPDAITLEQFYTQNADNFKAQEYRTISLVALDVKDLLKNMTVAEEDVLIEYQNRIDEFREPEKREVKQLLFDDAATAQKAAEALAAGKAIEDVAKELKASNETLLLGVVTASGMMPEAEKAVFSLAAGVHTAPIQTSFGWHVFQVTRIEPERVRPLAEVKEQVTEDLRTQRVGNEAFELSNTLQDDLAGGATLEEAAQSINVTVRSFGPVNSNGEAPDGTAIRLPENFPELLPTAFGLTEGEVSNLMETAEGSYYALRVDSILPERTRALDEIRGTVIEAWKKEQKGKNLQKLATGIAASLAKENAAQVASTTGATLFANQAFTRNSAQFGDKHALPAMMLAAIFSAKTGDATEASALPDGSYAVAKLTSIEKADAESEANRPALQRAQENLRAVYADELYVQYMAYLRNKHGVSEPNQALIDSLLQ